MRSRSFIPNAVDILEDRVVMSAFSVPFSIHTLPGTHASQKSIQLTEREESEVNKAMTTVFNRFSQDITSALNSYRKSGAKSGSNVSTLLTTFNAKVTQSLNRLAGSLTGLSLQIPFGGVNLNPVLEERIVGPGGVTDTTTKVTTPSLQSQLTSLTPSSSVATFRHLIQSTESLVRTDVKDYINLAVTNGDIKLTRGATLPPLS